MVQNIINEIKEAEEKAKGIIASARKDSDKIIDNANVKAKEIRKSIENETNAILSKAENTATADAEKERGKIEKEYDNKIKKVRTFSANVKKEKEALDYIIKRVYE